MTGGGQKKVGYDTRCLAVRGRSGEHNCRGSPWPEQRESVVVEADDGGISRGTRGTEHVVRRAWRRISLAGQTRANP